MSLFGSMFADAAAPLLMDVFGNDSVSYRNLAQINGAAGSTSLAWCSLGPAVRRTRPREYGLEMYYERHGWVITDPASGLYCGVGDIQIGGRIIQDGLEYTIDEARPRESGQIVDFRCTRVDWIETRRSDLRGRQ